MQSENIFDIRSLITAGPGHKFVLCDLAQIEPRVLAWLAGQTKMLEAVRNGYGVYEAAAVATGKYDGPKGGFKKLKALYQAQKAQTLALGYGCGWERYIEAAMTLAQYDVCALDRLDEKTGKPIYGSAARDQVKAFRANNPEIPALWEKLDNAFHACLGRDFVMELPSGRVMTYRNVQRREKTKIIKIYDEATGELLRQEPRKSWAFTAEIDGNRYELYGGLLTENITQAVAREVFGYHMLMLRDAGIHVPFSAHDEAICRVQLDFDPKIVEKIMSTTPPWLAGCPIGAEAKESPCYLK